jgi:protein-tyrosine phosphatase
MPTVLVTCTANICRSPFAAELLEGQLATAGLGPAAVTSAGTDGMVGATACPALWNESGLEIPVDHRARQVTPEMVSEADLVIALATDHRSHLASLAPAGRKKVFTLAEAAGLAAVITQPGHALASASGSLTGLDDLDPLTRVPELPQGAADRFAWLVGEMDAWRGSLNPEAELSVDDPHQVRSALHSDAAVLIQEHVRAFGESISRVMEAEPS